jgi:glycopeptide antibiotics resistance protein
MFARHPYLSAFAVVYLAGIFAVSLTPGASPRLGFVGGLILLIPSGAILVVLLGNSRLATAVALAVTVCLWLELGRTAWFGSRDSAGTDITANIIGALLGVALTSTFVAIASRTKRRHSTAFSPISQKRR